MKTKNLTTLAAEPATASLCREPSNSPTAKSPLPSATLLRLGTIVAGNQVAAGFGGEDEARAANAVIAGIVIALNEIVPEKQFRQIMVQWEIDRIRLGQIFETAGLDTNDPDVQKVIDL